MATNLWLGLYNRPNEWPWTSFFLILLNGFFLILRADTNKLTIPSNGHSIAILDNEHVRAFHDVEFSLDYPTEEEQDLQRGAGNWRFVHEQAERCRRLGLPVTVIAVIMKTNYLKL